MVRGVYYDKNGVKKGAWSKEEDERLRAYVERYGHSNWRQLPRLAGLSRCGKSCRLRWVNYLRPNLKHGYYTPEEEQIIIKLHQQHGNKWSLIAEKLTGRTDNEVKNHWHSHLKKRVELCNHHEFQMKASDTCEIETTHECKETENPILANPPSSNISENSHSNPTQISYSTQCDANTAWDFWTQPFIPENSYNQEHNYPSPNYAANELDLDEYVSYFFDNTEFLCQMQELP